MHTERRKVIKEMLESKPFVSLKELFAQFPGVSGMTIRRDIDFFEKQGVAIKVRGGARSMKFITTTMEDKFPNRMMKNRRSKELLAKKAMDYLEPGRSIFLDSGTTMLTMSSMLTNERLTITTTGPNIALELLNKPNVIVNIIGGMVTRDNISVTGTLALKFLNAINIDTAFIVPSGVSASAGLSCGNFSECETKKLIVGALYSARIKDDDLVAGRLIVFFVISEENTRPEQRIHKTDAVQEHIGADLVIVNHDMSDDALVYVAVKLFTVSLQGKGPHGSGCVGLVLLKQVVEI